MTGWSFTVDGQTISTWQCTNGDLFQTEGYLMMRSETNFTQFVTSTYWAYLCIRLEKVTLNSYRYYVEEPPQFKIGNERFKLYPNSTLSSKADICHPEYGAVGSEYAVLIRTGSEGSVSIKCPWTSLGRYDYTYMTSDDLVTCEGKGDSWNLCVDETRMVFNLVSCSTQIVHGK
ncbi:uncharacterized protein LOC127878645 [Dreissena polymorpha]|uniref:uncharacterized protein LOC127878645 n=1 Tax=Dreissena polymorpha TaxID=45954 RepID=UPI00226535B6|nr:uncharacterized protein LOC127878645 [Dreissena polymorpha]